MKKIEKKGKHILILAYIIFLFALIFSRHSPGSMMDGVNSISKIVYFGGFALIAFSLCYLFYKYHKENNLREFKKINLSYIFLLSFFVVSLIGARSAIRLIMVLAPSASAIIGFFSVVVWEKARKQKDETIKLVFTILVIIVILSSLYTFYFNYKVSLANAKAMIPSVYTYQWQKAMSWVRNNTDKNAVFSHWWDYGYWLQSIGLMEEIQLVIGIIC